MDLEAEHILTGGAVAQLGLGLMAAHGQVCLGGHGTDGVDQAGAYVWLYDETAVPDDTKDDCPCGCGAPDCGCMDNSCGGKCCDDTGCGDDHSFILLAQNLVFVLQ